MNKKMTKVIGVAAVLALIAVAFVGAGAATDYVVDSTQSTADPTYQTLDALANAHSEITSSDTLVIKNDDSTLAKALTISGTTEMKGAVTLASGGSITISANTIVTLAAGGLLPTSGVTNGGTIVVNDYAGLTNALSIGGAVKLGSDITCTGGVSVGSATLTIPHDYTLTMSANTLTITTNNSVINNGTIELEDNGSISPYNYVSNANGTIVVVSTTQLTGALNNTNGVQAGNVELGANLSIPNGSKVIAGLTLVVPTSMTLTVGGDNTLTIYGTVDASTGTLTISDIKSLTLGSASLVKTTTVWSSFSTYITKADAGAAVRVVGSSTDTIYIFTSAYDSSNVTKSTIFVSTTEVTHGSNTTVVGYDKGVEYTITVPEGITLTGDTTASFGTYKITMKTNGITGDDRKVSLYLKDSVNYDETELFRLKNTTGSTDTYLKYGINKYSSTSGSAEDAIAKGGVVVESVVTATSVAEQLVGYKLTAGQSITAGTYKDTLTFEAGITKASS